MVTPTSVRKGYVDTDEGQVHYRYGGPPDYLAVVLLHQNTSSSDMFTEAIGAFDDDRYVVAPDIPGAGLSYTPEEVSSMDYYADAIVEALDGLGIETYHLCGHHTGASVAAEIAVAYPDTVESVTFSGPPYLTAEERRAYAEEYDPQEAVPPLDPDGDYLIHHWENHATVSGLGDLEHRHRAVVDAILAQGAIGQVYEILWDEDFQQLFREIGDLGIPRMVVSSADDTLRVGYERVISEHPDVRAVELGGGDYEPLLDAERFVKAVEAFVDD